MQPSSDFEGVRGVGQEDLFGALRHAASLTDSRSDYKCLIGGLLTHCIAYGKSNLFSVDVDINELLCHVLTYSSRKPLVYCDFKVRSIFILQDMGTVK
jgi:hypothetical protein